MKSTHTVLIDAHVHFHACFNAREFLDSAYDNFSRTAAEKNCGGRFSAFVLMTETSQAHWFDSLKGRAISGSQIADGWNVVACEHDCQIRLERTDGARLNVVSGYQVITAEKLEVLALGCRKRIPDGGSADRVIEVARAAGAIPVLPWGFGKWLGRRGRCVRSLVDASAQGGLFLGDNSNRLAGFPEPSIFRQARSAGIQILPGTDPLPFAREAGRTGTFGFLMEFDPASADANSWSVVRDKLARHEPIIPFGKLENPWPFARNQVAMQLRMRYGIPGGAA